MVICVIFGFTNYNQFDGWPTYYLKMNADRWLIEECKIGSVEDKID